MSNKSGDCLSLFVLNATSLAKPNAVQLLSTELLQLRSHCGLISESWLTSKHESAVVAIKGYDLYRRDRCKGRGDGVCAYVRNDVTCSIYCPAALLTANRPDVIEIMWLKCFFDSRHYYIACCYNPPRHLYRDSQFVGLLTSDLEYINSICCDAVVIVAGDFNQLDTSFLEQEQGLVQMVTVSTPVSYTHLTLPTILRV